jgi:hypothetical protein
MNITSQTPISKYLTYAESIKSPNAARLGIANEPNEQQLANMKHVATQVFDPVREHIGGPLAATSFFRSKELNDATPGSSKTSQHMTGEAIDIDADVYGIGDNLSIFHYIRSQLTFDQLILEYPDAHGKPSWVHVSLSGKGHNRGEVLVKLKDKYIPYSHYKVGMV